MFTALPAAIPQVQRRPKATSAKKVWTEEEDRQLAACYEEGVTIVEIGLRLGVDRFAVIHRAKRLGVPQRRPGRVNGWARDPSDPL